MPPGGDSAAIILGVCCKCIVCHRKNNWIDYGPDVTDEHWAALRGGVGEQPGSQGVVLETRLGCVGPFLVCAEKDEVNWKQGTVHLVSKLKSPQFSHIPLARGSTSFVLVCFSCDTVKPIFNRTFNISITGKDRQNLMISNQFKQFFHWFHLI